MIANIFKFIENQENLIMIFSGAFYQSTLFDGYYPGDEYDEMDNLDLHPLATPILKGDNIKIVDLEEDKEYELNMKKLRHGWKLLICNYPEIYARIMNPGAADIYDYEILIQLSIFGEVVYG